MRKLSKSAEHSATSPPAAGADPRIAALMRALRPDPQLAPVVEAFEAQVAKSATGRKFGSNGLKVSGKLFALFTQGTLVVKLPRERVTALVTAGVGTRTPAMRRAARKMISKSRQYRTISSA